MGVRRRRPRVQAQRVRARRSQGCRSGSRHRRARCDDRHRTLMTYPPEQHLLRDLRFSFEHDDGARTSRAWMPVVSELCTDHGHARAGAIATLVDVIGGGLAASAAAPDWIATADLTLHLVRGAPAGSAVEARAAVLRKGRTTVVMDVQ